MPATGQEGVGISAGGWGDGAGAAWVWETLASSWESLARNSWISAFMASVSCPSSAQVNPLSITSPIQLRITSLFICHLLVKNAAPLYPGAGDAYWL